MHGYTASVARRRSDCARKQPSIPASRHARIQLGRCVAANDIHRLATRDKHTLTQLPQTNELTLRQEGEALFVTLNRPHRRNAMNGAAVAELDATFAAVEPERGVRVVVLRGAGGHFCSGGDLSDIRDGGNDAVSRQRAVWDFNRGFGRMITRVNQAPQFVVALLEGAVMGGGLGLVCVSDVAIAERSARFAMPETGLGIVPAQILPFVVERIGRAAARQLALLGERIDADEAHRLGLVHEVCEGEDEMLAAWERVRARLRSRAPGATAATKALLHEVGEMPRERLLDRGADAFAEAMLSDEGEEGMAAFAAKRTPSWAE